MKSTLTYKILKEHLVDGVLSAGQEIAIRIDQTLTQDATGTMAYLQFEAMGLDRVKNELAVSYVDHNTVQVGFENADDHRYLQSVAERYGVVYSRPGNGICHQVHLERFGEPGKTLLGSDSHTPTGGGLGMIAIGAGGLDVAVAMGGGAFHLIAPKVIEIRLIGKLQPWVTAKDVILTVLQRFGVKGNVNCVFEYTGEGVASLSVPQRATICNMGAECGVTTSLFPSDAVTKQFLHAQKRTDSFRPLAADKDAHYDDVYIIDLSNVVPKTAAPHSPGNILDVQQLDGMPVQQVLIGSCTNSSYAELHRVANILSGHRVSPTVSLGIAPGSREVMLMLARDGSLEKMVTAGARILESACGFCIGNHQSPETDAVSLRTNNRNFEGRSGTKSAQVYLVSPETAALSAITGTFTNPLSSHGIPYPKDMEITEFIVDDGMLIFPPEDGSAIEVLRGPNIGDPPKSRPLPQLIEGVCTLKAGDKITTDHIMPAGARLKYRSNIPAYARYTFEGLDPTFHDRAQENQKKQQANIVVAGFSYGQGSSREHAAICPMYLGVQIVLAKSFERIHQANLCNFGILPVEFVCEADYDDIAQGDSLQLSDVHNQLEAMVKKQKSMILYNKTQEKEIEVVAHLSLRQMAILLSGGLLNYTKTAL
ncbi:MAG: aconitate hydratase [Sphaerochaetaceae bacterium]|jgi:aconitate hydratase|nr:aconitate hydratase [Sphaerochaetaceae bacterium]MDY0371713.1 aconitate hydratase [Sphaerochaetaceae bacterium]